jgi:hypothetical protein
MVMTSNRITNKIVQSSIASFLMLACAATDNTPFEPSRDTRISSLASAACSRYSDKTSGCPGYGTAAGQRYATEGDCERDFQTQAAKLWPDAECNRGQISAPAYAKCEARAKAYACSTGIASLFDAISAQEECKAAKVCTDAIQ